MKAIYVHGVSERASDPKYDRRMLKRTERLNRSVVPAIGENLDKIESADWGHLRPKVFVPKPGSNEFVTFGAGEDVAAIADINLQHTLDPEDFIQGGELVAASFVEAALMRVMEDGAATISSHDAAAVEEWIAELRSVNARMPAPAAADNVKEILTRILQTYPESKSTAPQYETFGTEQGSLSKLIRLIGLARRKASASIQAPVKTRAQVELALRWSDAIWYVGGPGRDKAQAHVLNAWDEISEDCEGDDLVVILAHSLGSLLSFETINSEGFLGRGLHQRARWALIALGGQLPVYESLNVIPGRQLRSELKGRAGFRNIVDQNDPLGFLFGDENIDIPTLSGVNFVGSHMSYLDSSIVMSDIQSALEAIMVTWNAEPSNPSGEKA